MTEEHKLLKTQKNYVFKVLQKKGLEPANFSWKYEQISDPDALSAHEDIIVTRLEYLDGEYYFQFEPHTCTFCPGETQFVQYVKNIMFDNQIFDYVGQWAEYLKRQIEAPDLWAEMEKYKFAFSLAPAEQIVNEPIPTYEAEKIIGKLSLLADKIEEQFELTNEQNQFVRSKLDYLADATKRQRSVDWAHTLIGVSVTIAVGLSLAPDKAKELWELLKTIGEFIHLIGP